MFSLVYTNNNTASMNHLKGGLACEISTIKMEMALMG